jgi:arylsulfatase A-like enzyme
MKKTLGQILSRREFLRVTGTAGAYLLGASAVFSGCNHPPNRQTDTNVVVAILDSLRKDHVGAYGNGWIRTPNLDSLSKESLRFTRAYPESIPTIPARRAIHTGLRTWPFRNWHVPKGAESPLYGWQPIPNRQTHLAEILRRNGYETLFVTDNLHQFKASMNFQRGFDAFDWIRGQTTDWYRPIWTFPPHKIKRTLLKGASHWVRDNMSQYFANTSARKTEKDWFAPQVFTRASEFLEAAKEGQPFLLVVDSYDPHEPWDPPEEYVALYDEGYDGPEPYLPVYGPRSYLTERELKRMRALYAAEVTMADRWLGHFLEKMSDLKLSENTLLVVLSDHGHALGEHNMIGKVPAALYPELTDITFFIRHPEGKGAGKISDYYASTHDVAPTILGFLGIEPPEPMEGQDLSVLLDGGEPESRKHFTLGFHDHVWTRDARYVMFSRNDGKEVKLYDVQEDPNMRIDIAGNRSDVVKHMFKDYILKDAGGPLPRY